MKGSGGKSGGSNNGSNGSNGAPLGVSGAASIDSLIDSNRDLLVKSGGDCLSAELEARLMYPWCADLPSVVSRRLPLLFSFWRFAKRWTWRLLLVSVLYAVTSATVNFYFEKQLEDWQRSDTYMDICMQLNVMTRKLAVWTGMPKLQKMHELARGECIVGNPVFRSPLHCCNCKFNVTLSKVNNVEKVMENFDKLTSTGKARSFLIINHQQKPVSYQQLRETALTNEADVDLGYNRFITLSGPTVSSLRDLFADEKEPPADSTVMWRFGHVEGLRHFRPLVNRPNFVSRDLEINLSRQFLFFGSRHKDKVNLGSLGELDGQVYIVGLAGEIVFTVKSNPDCCKKPGNRVSRLATLRPGRLLSLPSSCYVVQARRNGTEYAAAYMGSVVMSQHPAIERQSSKARPRG